MKHRFLLMAGLGGIALSAAACAAVGNTSIFDGSGGSGGAHASSSQSASTGMGGSIPFDAGNGDSGAPVECGEATQFIYVIGSKNELYSFSPAMPPTFKQIGIINCPQDGGVSTPRSMAVDRYGTAWVLFKDGNLYKVDTTTAACNATAFEPNKVPDFHTFGMAFVFDNQGSSAETLYISSYTGVGIDKIDVHTLKVTPVGTYDKLKVGAELTGTGDAHLFGFFLSTPPAVAEIDKTNSQILWAVALPTVNIVNGWAFAFWGGDLYLFTAPQGNSQVDKYSLGANDGGTTTNVVPDAGFIIVGAGVSTCAPTKPSP